MVFNTIAEYEKTMVDLASGKTSKLVSELGTLKNFTPLKRSQKRNVRITSELASILNDNNVVEIEGWILKIAKEDSCVYALKRTAGLGKEAILNFETESYKKSYTKKFVKDDGVLESIAYMNKANDISSAAKVRWGCKQGNVNDAYIGSNSVAFYARSRAGTVRRFQIESVFRYTNDWVWARLKSGILIYYYDDLGQLRESQGDDFIPANLTAWFNYKNTVFARRCASCQYKENPEYYSNIDWAHYSQDYYTITHYEQTYGLAYYRHENVLAFNYTDQNGTTHMLTCPKLWHEQSVSGIWCQ